MSSKKEKKAQLVQELNDAGRRWSTVTILFHQSMAEKAGLSGADHKYMDVLLQEGPMTAGQLGELCGLTTGAVTGLIDRLEKQGLVKRQNDPNDRRKVMVVPQFDIVIAKMGPAFMALGAELEQFHDRYSEEELEVIKRYMNDAIGFFSEKVKEMRGKK